MFKPCPNCGFLVALIAGREASQRCPRCGSGLLEDGEAAPSMQADAPPPRHLRERPMERTPVASEATVADDVPAPVAHAMPGDAPAPESDGSIAPPASFDDDVPDDAPATHAPGRSDAAPSFLSRRDGAMLPRGRRWPWAIALPVLALLLAVQLLLAQRTELAQDARWRPLLANACSVLGCDVPAWREPAAFAMQAGNVRPHATRPGVLHVTASLRNDARWAQPLPVVVLSLSDIDGRVLASRAVPPSGYGRPARSLVPPGESVDIAFDVREPSPRVVSFDFQLR